MTKLKTDQRLLDALKSASTATPTRAQMEQQRISFVMGVLPENNAMTREEVRGVLDRQEGRNQQG